MQSPSQITSTTSCMAVRTIMGAILSGAFTGPAAELRPALEAAAAADAAKAEALEAKAAAAAQAKAQREAEQNVEEK